MARLAIINTNSSNREQILAKIKQDMIQRAFSSLITWIVALQLLSVIIGYTTRFGMYPWYSQLLKSSLTPPGYIFAIVWPLLYFTLSISGWKLYTENNNSLLRWY